jgi:hypothetical protein
MTLLARRTLGKLLEGNLPPIGAGPLAETTDSEEITSEEES